MKPPFILPQSISNPFSQLIRMPMAYLSKHVDIKKDLEINEIDKDPIHYLGNSFINALAVFFIFLIIYLITFVYLNNTKSITNGVSNDVLSNVSDNLGSASLFGFVMGALYFTYLILFPKWLALKRAQKIDEKLVFAIRYLSVQVSAGVSLFDALQSASTKFGVVSDEFRKICTWVNAGMDLSDATELSAEKSPSIYYKRIMWQISNSTKSGYAIKDILDKLVNFLNRDQQTRFKKFGSDLNIISIFYLATSIIFPTLGLIFMVIVSSFGVLNPDVSLLVLFIVAVTFFNIIFLGLIRSRRPKGI